MKTRPFLIITLFIAGMILVGLLRLSGFQESLLTPFAAYATPLYVAVTLVTVFAFIRSGTNFNHVGFDLGFNWRYLWLAVAGVVALQVSAALIAPVLESVLGSGRDLSRFAGVEGSLTALLTTLALSWTFAAFGEEIAFRIVMLRGLAMALGESRWAWVIAVLVQAVVFGLVHLYQGPAGVAGATISGLVFGILTVAARGSIWPAALAHGINNSIGLIGLYLGAS